MWLIVIFALVAVIFILNVITTRRTESVPVAFAGSADGSDVTVTIQKERNRTIYTQGENRLDLSSYIRYYISGHSLEKVGIADKTFVYAKPWSPEDKLSLIPGRFVIFSYDVEFQRLIHPDKVVSTDTFKIRKAVRLIETKLKKESFFEQIRPILQEDKELTATVEKYEESLWHKYSTTSNYYKDKPTLIMSITYRDGKDKDYSFHSPEFLKGIVEYKSAD
jgi:hypothetical protein